MRQKSEKSTFDLLLPLRQRAIYCLSVVALMWSLGFAGTSLCLGQPPAFVNPNEHNFEDDGPISDPGQSNREGSWASQSAQAIAAEKLQGIVPVSRSASLTGFQAEANNPVLLPPKLDLSTQPNESVKDQPSQIVLADAGSSDPMLRHAALSQTHDVRPDWSQALQSRLRNIDWTKMVGSLVIVLGGYLLFVMFMRRIAPATRGNVPKEVVEIIGLVHLDARRHLQLIRLGSKLLLVAHGPEGIANIGEIDDPHEVEYLVQQCGRNRSRSKYEPVRMPRREKAGKGANDLTLEKLVQSLQQAIRNPTGQAEFEA